MTSEPAAADNAKRILLVDDNEHGLQARRLVLEQLGFEITTANSGRMALESYGTGGAFDLLVTDFRMPGMDGVQLIALIRAITPALPIIMISGFTETLGLSEENTGANIVLQKSANEASHLVRSVSKLLEAPAKRPRSTGAPRKTRKSRGQSA